MLAILVGVPSRAAHAQTRIRNSEHYRVHSDLDSQLTDDLITRMEAMYEQYSQRLADFRPRDRSKFEVYLFSKKKDYAAFTDNSVPNTGGVFMPSRQLLAAFLEIQGRDNLRRTLQHEAFHQFAFIAISPRLPVWLNEGIAQVYEEGIWTGKVFLLGQVGPTRLRQVQQDMKDRRWMPLRQFMQMTDEAWANDRADTLTGAARYSQAWAMTHFLIYARDSSSGDPKYRARFIAMLKLIHDGRRASEAFEQAFSDNYDGFQARFLEYIRALKPTPEATMVENQTILGDMLSMLDSEHIHFNTCDLFRQKIMKVGYRLHYTRGNVEWSTLDDPGEYFRDPQGRLLTSDQLYFSPRGGAPLPDLVCKIPGLQSRTIFHDTPEKAEHETIVEGK
jgi:hypothetical protein